MITNVLLISGLQISSFTVHPLFYICLLLFHNLIHFRVSILSFFENFKKKTIEILKFSKKQKSENFEEIITMLLLFFLKSSLICIFVYDICIRFPQRFLSTGWLIYFQFSVFPSPFTSPSLTYFKVTSIWTAQIPKAE